MTNLRDFAAASGRNTSQDRRAWLLHGPAGAGHATIAHDIYDTLPNLARANTLLVTDKRDLTEMDRAALLGQPVIVSLVDLPSAMDQLRRAAQLLTLGYELTLVTAWAPAETCLNAMPATERWSGMASRRNAFESFDALWAMSRSLRVFYTSGDPGRTPGEVLHAVRLPIDEPRLRTESKHRNLLARMIDALAIEGASTGPEAPRMRKGGTVALALRAIAGSHLDAVSPAPKAPTGL